MGIVLRCMEWLTEFRCSHAIRTNDADHPECSNEVITKKIVNQTHDMLDNRKVKTR